MKKRKKQPSLFVWKMTALISAALFLSICWILVDSLFSITEREEHFVITVPDFCAREADLIDPVEHIVLHTEYRYDSKVPRGIVISQRPLAGERKKLSSRRPICEVTLLVSLGEEGEE